LFERIEALAPKVDSAMQARDFTGALTVLAGARDAVDQFFDGVMVMADDERVRGNRLALLARLHVMMNQVADLSKLSNA
jgi:glycyl-tRNA synthetase beta chain